MEKQFTLVDQAYEKIRNKVCDFELFPGQVLSDFTLSKELGMSRTPIRQALQRLERDGLIADAGTGKSYEVCQITDEEIIELFDARECIEIMALKLAMDRGLSETQLLELNRINHKMQTANSEGRLKENFHYDQEFHDYLVALSGNKKLNRFHDSLLMQLRRMRVLSYLDPNCQDKAYNDHGAVLAAIEANNSQKAQQALAVHIQTSKRDYLKLLDDKIAMEGFGVLRFFSGLRQGEE